MMDLFGITIIAGALTGSYWLGYWVGKKHRSVDELLGKVDGKTKLEFIADLERWAIWAWKNNDEIRSCTNEWAKVSHLAGNEKEHVKARTAMRTAIKHNLPKRAKIEMALFDMSPFNAGTIIMREIAGYRGIDYEF